MERMIATALGAGRTAIGIGLVVAPGLVGRGWIGESAAEPATKVALRALGARDAALGAGLLLALQHGRGARGWAEASVVADAVDAIATLAAGDHIPARGRWTALALALPAAVVGAVVARRLDPQDTDDETDEGPPWLPREPARG